STLTNPKHKRGNGNARSDGRIGGRSTRRLGMDMKLEDGLKTLLESGKRKGYLTYAQVKAFVPDDGADNGRLDRVLQLVEEMGIDLIEESEAEDRDGDTAAELDAELRGEIDLAFVDDGDGRHIDDPVRMYLTQMGEI